ncbi:MAG TPA: CDP-alcohol phosphatidyltransferase family protein [Roseiflexaceae bacterium]|nr:CDP-alcohol phosphatidyltransferase family protein [Roseiflexaceae bacterium]
MMLRTRSDWPQVSAAWAVHLYTACGAVLAFLIALAAIQGNVVQALWFGFVAMIIDGTDGMLARRFRVREMVPWFDGSLLDNIVDYLTYVFAPVLLLWTAGYLPGGTTGMILAILPLLASSYQFCRVDAKTEDHFFLGFPSYWNVIAFYAFVLGWSPTTVGIILVICSVLVFVPIRYLYPSRTVALRPITLVVSAVWMLTYALLLLEWPTPSMLVLNISVLGVIYYVAVSLYLNFGRRSAPHGA